MQLPVHNLVIRHQNAEATMPLTIPLQLVCNTGDYVLYRNIEANSRLDREWLYQIEPHDGVAVLVGGGPSLADTLADVLLRHRDGATIFALNGAARYLNDAGLMPDYQVLLDPRPETAGLVGPAFEHLFASQCAPACFEQMPDAKMWHLEIENIETHFPPERVAAGGYALIGGAASVGLTAACLAYAMGYREIHCYGYDSSQRADASHAYPQPMNDSEPLCTTEFDGQEYVCSLTMRLQADRFIGTARALEAAGCKVRVHGSGLLPAMYNAPRKAMTEVEKYERLWAYREYRQFAPGEYVADIFLDVAKPSGRVIDFGCGTGRGALRLKAAGLDVTLVDFADNCRDLEAMPLPFIRHDLSEPLELPQRVSWGYCTDVMEHIPPEDVSKVVRNVLGAADKVFFQISTVPDECGVLIGQDLHLTVRPHDWWGELFETLGYSVLWDKCEADASLFLIANKE